MTPAELPVAVELRSINGLQLECATAGDRGRPLVILLHGFPDLWQGWHYQIAPLVDAGFRVLAPNQRGYGKSGKPRRLADYDLDRLASDVTCLADSEGYSTFSLAGHDWGGIVAWWVAALFPERINRLVILNAPHPGIFFRFLLRSPRQCLKSWYVGLFQLPWIPEALLSRSNFELLFRSVAATSCPGIFDDSDRKLLVAGWSQPSSLPGGPNSLTAMLNYYRAIARRSSSTMQRRIQPPTLILMSDADPTEEMGLAAASLKLCDAGIIQLFRGAAHWIQREEPDKVTKAMMDFICSPDSRRQRLPDPNVESGGAQE